MVDKDKSKSDTKQSLKFKPNGQFAKGTGVPAGFNKHPENRHNGSWHKEDTPRYWLETMMKMDEDELQKIYDNEKMPFFKRKMAKCIKDGEWTEIKEMIQEVYGKMPVVNVEVKPDEDTTEETSKFIRGFVLP